MRINLDALVAAVALAAGLSVHATSLQPSQALPSTPWPGGARMALSLSFDDGRESQVTQGLPLFARHGAKVTLFVVPSAVERRLDRRVVVARPRVKPVALVRAVHDGRVRIEVGLIGAVMRKKREPAVGLIAVGRQDGPVLAVRHRDLLARAERDFRKPGVGRRQRLIRLVR